AICAAVGFTLVSPPPLLPPIMAPQITKNPAGAGLTENYVIFSGYGQRSISLCVPIFRITATVPFISKLILWL
ncbi:TPA: hypothetical protein ACWCAB_005701, partial [Escherichia coli]